jgi:integrase
MDITTTTPRTNTKVNVHLREKKLKDGSRSLYLDYYPAIPNPKKPGQFTRREFLNIYILPTDTPADHARKWGRAKELEITRQRAHGTNARKQELALHDMRRRTTLSDFMRYHALNADELKASSRASWTAAASMFDHYLAERGIDPQGTTFDQLDVGLIHDFRRYLLNEAKDRRVLKAGGMSRAIREDRAGKLAKTTAAGYFNTVLSALKLASTGKSGTKLLNTPIHAEFERIEAKAAPSEYLTMEEVHSLVKTPCKDDLLRRASLFSIVTGLRFSDIANLKWSDLELVTPEQPDATKAKGKKPSKAEAEAATPYVVIKKVIKKADRIENIPITDEAVSLLLPSGWGGERGDRGKGAVKPASSNGSGSPAPWQSVAKSDPDAFVFAPLKYSTALNPKLQAWMAQAGITKDITFHSLRHTFGALHIDQDTSLYELSKLLTHSSTRTTERVYAHLLDAKKRKAAQRINIGLDK